MTSVATRLPPVLLLAVVLHAAVLPELRVAGVAADVLLLVAVASGMVAGPHRGAVAGFATGLLADCFLLTPFGLSALVHLAVAWSVGSLHTTVLHPVRWVVPLTALGASAAGVVVYAVAGAAVGHGHLLNDRLVPVAVGVGVLNAVLSPGAVRLVGWAFRPAVRWAPAR